jgi:hypothetical protein
MGQFKPMVKMETTEPSVILKLKKGGHVAMNRGGEYGFANMRAKSTPVDDGYAAPGAAPMRPSMADRRMAASLMKKGGKVKHEDAAQDRAMIKKAMAGKKFASGGKIDSAMDKTTIKGNAGKFLNTKVVDGDKNDSAKGTGKVKMGAAGYKDGGTISGNAGKFLNTKVVDGDKTDTAKGTGGVKMGNKGGFKTGGTVTGNDAKFAVNNVDTAKPGPVNTATGGVKNGNAGGFKKGGVAKKHYATGGAVDTGRAVAMPKKPVSKPVSNTAQSGTFKKGGKVAHKADGGSLDDQQMPLRDMSGGAYGRSIGPDQSDMELANSIRNAPGNAMNAVMRLLGKRPSAGAGRGMVNPPMARKKGGSAKC